MLKDVQAGPPPVEAPATFAPQGFLFQAPVGLSSFKFEPLTPRSADSFLRPRLVRVGLHGNSFVAVLKYNS